MKENIVLCGFMGCGKTSVGKILAQKTGRTFCDTDLYLEDKFGMEITEIFNRYGEQRFREMENEVVKEVSAKQNMVIACGGGTVLREENVKIFRENKSKIFLLDTPIEMLQERLSADVKRPLLQKPNRQEIIEELYSERIHQYRAAADEIIPADMPVIAVVKKMIKEYL